MDNGWAHSPKPFTFANLCGIIIPALIYLFQVAMAIKPLPIRTLSPLHAKTFLMLSFGLMYVFAISFFTLFTLVLIFLAISPILFSQYVDRLIKEQQPTDPA